ncbi:MAG: ferritin family protein [Thermoplasmata archaeon]
MADLKQIIATAIEFEKFGVEYYLRFHDLVADEKAKPLMKGLADDEREHARILEEQLRMLGGKARAPSKEELKKGLKEIFPEDVRRGSLATKDAISALKLGIRTEERSIEYYSKNAAAAGPKLKEIFSRLEKMERGHLELLTENLRYLEDDGVWYGYVPFLD